MAEISYTKQILEVVENLDAEKQREVLDFARGLKRPQGITGKEAIRIARELNFPKEDLEEMMRAIEEEFERIDDFPEIDLDE